MNYAPSMYVLCEIQLNDGLMQPLKFPSAKKDLQIVIYMQDTWSIIFMMIHLKLAVWSLVNDNDGWSWSHQWHDNYQRLKPLSIIFMN